MTQSVQKETMTSNDRYKRHHQIEGFKQDILSKSRVIILGAGATGNELLKNLSLLGIGFIDVFDLDTIEGHNLTRSVLFRDSDIAASKAETAVARAKEIDPNITINAIHGDIFETLTFDRVQQANCVIIGLDNIEARMRVNLLCRLAGTPLINTGIDHRNIKVSWHPFKEGDAPACYECNLSSNVYDSIASKHSCGGLRRALATAGLVPTTIVTSAAAASMAVSFCLQTLRGDLPEETQSWHLDTITGVSRIDVIKKNAGCYSCAGLKTKTNASPWGDGAKQIAKNLINEGYPPILIDPLVEKIQCLECGKSEDQGLIYKQPIRRWTDSLAICPHCRKACESSLKLIRFG
jgi:molybdopterin-synthase adenylyltransferase